MGNAQQENAERMKQFTRILEGERHISKEFSISQKFYFGLIPKDCVDEQIIRESLPLKDMRYEGVIDDSIARIQLTLVYFNQGESDMEVEFYFSKTLRSAFISLEAQIGEKNVFGKIKQKNQAFREFQDALNQGQTAVYSQLAENNRDIIQIQLGNAPKGMNIEIQFTYLQELTVSVDKFWNITLPGALRPRYTPSGYDGTPIDEEVAQNSVCQNFSVQLTLKSYSKIIFSQSPSHNSSTVITPTDSPNQINISLKQTVQGNQRDFVLIFRDQEFNKPKISIGRYQEDPISPFCARITFVPEFTQFTDFNDAYTAYIADGNEGAIDLDNKKAEFIFILDRSGSMDGFRIQKAKEAVMIFLKSLPQDSYFQICSFGDNFENIFPKGSQKTTQESVATAIEKLELFKADMNGTEILQPITKFMEAKVKPDYPMLIFLLTDGSVSNTKQVLSQIRDNSNSSKRVYTVGIGDGCSEQLIIGGAIGGQGTHIFIKDSEDMNMKILSLLEYSLQSFISEFEVQFDRELVERIVPVPETVRSINFNETFQCYVFFNPKFQSKKQTTFTFKYRDFHTQQIKEVTENIDFDQHKFEDTELYHQVGIHQAINAVEMNIDKNDYQVVSVLLSAKETRNFNSFVDLSVKYQVLTQFTAFILVSPESEKINKPLEIATQFESSYQQNSSYEEPCEQDDCDVPSYQCQEQVVRQMEEQPKLQMKSSRKKEQKSENVVMSGACDEQSKESDFSSMPIKSTYSNPKPIPNSQPIPNPKPIQQEDNLIPKISELIKLQEFEGFWKCDEELMRLIAISQKSFLESKPKEIDSDSVWMTIFIVRYIEQQYQDQKPVWNIVVRKAKSWLQNNGISDPNKYETIEIKN